MNAKIILKSCFIVLVLAWVSPSYAKLYAKFEAAPNLSIYRKRRYSFFFLKRNRYLKLFNMR